MSVMSRTVPLAVAATLVAAATAVPALVPSATAAPTRATPAAAGRRACPPAARALGYSDALNKLVRRGVEVGGLSSLAYDRHAHAWVSAVDNDGSQPERIWFFRNLHHPKVVRNPLVLRKPNGTAYTGLTADNEGLAVLPDGRFVVSSETEPSIRIYGRDGVQRAALPVPHRFRVAPAGQATDNATLEGLTLSPSGHRLIAAMEGSLSGDHNARLHRFLVYDLHAGSWRLTKQVAYRTGTNQRIPEVASISGNRLVVEEAYWSADTGNEVRLYQVRGLDAAKDVSKVADLNTAPRSDVLHKRLLANLVKCPTLGAPAREKQRNPLLDNYEGMAVTDVQARCNLRHRIGVDLISDDNFSAEQTTRVLRLRVRLSQPVRFAPCVR